MSSSPQRFGALQAAKNLKNVIFFASIMLSLLVFLGSSFNHLGHKYTRAVHFGACKKAILNINVADSQMCCETANHEYEWVCLASYDRLNRVFASKAALIIPMIPLFATTVTEIFIQKAINRSIYTSTSLRFFLCVLLITFRTSILYLLAHYLQEYWQGDMNSDCWYADHTSDFRCKSHFDFSDHVVLLIGQYMIPVNLEVAYIFTKVYTQRGGFWSLLLRYSLPLLAALIITSISLRDLLFTCMFFHTPAESFVGYVLVMISITIPTYYLSSTQYWNQAIFGSK